MSKPFKLKSGNKTSFKQMGSSPIRQVDPPVESTTGEKIASFITPESPGEALLSVLPIGGKGISKWLTKSKTGSKILKKVPGLQKLFTPSTTVKNKGFDFAKGDKSGVWKKTVEFKLNEMKSIGKNLDEVGFDATKLTPKDVKFRGGVHGRNIVEVKLPSGQTQLFYKSSGMAGKKGSGTGGTTEGMWQPYGGHADMGKTQNWFIKDKGYKDFYGSNTFRDISGNLDRIMIQSGSGKSIKATQALASKRK